MVIDKRDAGESLTKTDRELLEKSLKALNNSAELIDTVKNLKNVKSARLPVEKIDLCEVVAGVVNGFSGVQDRAIRIHFSPVKDCWVEANYLLKEVFINLIGNALKHSNGPLDVYISINEVTSDGVRYYASTVEDDGPGIPDTQKKELFDQVSCEGTKTKGKGLGLCLVKSLVDRFHGKVRVEDRVPGDYKNGVRFIVMLPAADK
jgi:signal transduction histidine kinase